MAVEIIFPFNYLNNGYQEEYQTSFTETTPDAGIPFRRETYTDVGRTIIGTALMNDSQKAEFDTLYLRDTRSGSKPVMMYDCINKINREAKFIGKPSIVRTGNRWSVSYRFYLEPTTVIAELYLITEDGRLVLTEDDKAIVLDVERNV